MPETMREQADRLVERLRDSGLEGGNHWKLFQKAADRIEELEAALMVVSSDMRAAAVVFREYGAVLAADILTAQAAKAKHLVGQALLLSSEE